MIGAGHYVFVGELDDFVLSRLQFTPLRLNHKQFVVLYFHLKCKTVRCNTRNEEYTETITCIGVTLSQFLTGDKNACYFLSI